jgi:hypothetical protein
MNAEIVALDAAFGGEVGHSLERANVLGATVWVAAVVKRVDPDYEVVCLQHLGEREGVGEEDGVASGHVCHRYILREFRGGIVLGHGYVCR